MQTTDKQAKWRPFHETIVEAIQLAEGRELDCLGVLIKATKIPKGHDEIMAAWRKKRGSFDLEGVVADLERQKQANTKLEDEKGNVDLDDLQHEAKMLLSLLGDRTPGRGQWDGFMQERFQNLHRLTSKALGK